MVQPSHQLSDAKRMWRPRALSLVPPRLDRPTNNMGPDSYAFMIRRLQALGYVEGKVVEENPVAATGKTIRGHEFRYFRMDCARDSRFAYRFTMGS